MDIISNILTTTFASTLLVLVVGYFLKPLIEKKLELYFQHKYDKKLIEFKNDVEIRRKAEIIAELMAEWIKNPEKNDSLNLLAIQAFLWLPPDLARNLASTLMIEEDSDDVRTIIQKVRKYLLGQDDDLDPRSIILFLNAGKNKQQSGG
jgi:hypothetical protein